MRPTQHFSRIFYKDLWRALSAVWPILSSLLGTMILLGLGIAHIEGWHLLEGVYFAFVTGLTVGYGDLVPTTPLTRTAAICIGFAGILCTGLIAAIAVHALRHLEPTRHNPPVDQKP